MPSKGFTRMIRDIHNQKILVPAITASLMSPDFKGFTVPVRGWTKRAYDGWFHPSTHSTWTARQLYYYLAAPEFLEEERPGLLFVLAVTQGSFWHEFVQRLLLDLGLLIPNPGTTKKDSVEKRVEVPLVDKEFNRRGHADGRLAQGLFEFKTMSERLIGKIKSWEDIRDNHPKYYAQTQDYLDMSGEQQMRYVVMQLASPFTMEEVVVPADPAFQAAQRDKYAEALQAVADQSPPPACCAIRSAQAKACPVRAACPVGRMS